MKTRNETSISCKENKTLREKYYCISHKSGLDIYVIPKKMSTSYALFGTRYGSRDNCFRLAGETEYTRVPDGIAHFLEHKLFESKDGWDTNERFARLGASVNAFTSTEMTAYEFSCTENFYEALAVLLDFVTHPYFTDENVAKEQGIIAQEIRGCEDNPGRCLYYGLLNLLYQKDSIRTEVCGTVESIAQITPALLYHCYNTFYQLSNMALVVCGDVDYEQVIHVADEQLCAKDKNQIERYFEAEPKFIEKKRSCEEMSIARPLFAIGFKDDYFDDPAVRLRRALQMRFLSDLLFGTSGAFYNDLYREGLLNSSFSCGYEGYGHAAFFLLNGETDKPEEVYDRTLAYLERMKETPPSRDDFERIRRSAYADYIRSFDSTDEIANEFLYHLFSDVDLFDVGEVFSSITYEEVVALLMSFFSEECCAMSIIYPKNKGESPYGCEN